MFSVYAPPAPPPVPALNPQRVSRALVYSSAHSPPTQSYEDDSTMMASTTWISQQLLTPYQNPSVESSTSNSHLAKPLLKRRRVTRACDECRRKKIKCDGKHPCTHCTVYSYDCTYDQPSNRRRNPGPQYIEGLEKDKQQLATLIRLLRPDIDPFDSNFDADKLISEMQGSSRTGDSLVGSPNEAYVEGSDAESMLESMVEAAGRLDIDYETGKMDFRGHSSSFAFLSQLRNNFQKVLGEDITTSIKSTAFPKPLPTGNTRTLAEKSLLPSREVALILVDSCLDDACALMKFVHRPTFDKVFNRIYEIPEHEWGQHERDFLPMLYEVMAVGCLFADNAIGEAGVVDSISEGTKYFLAGRNMVDLTDCCTIPAIQAVLFMIIFLQSSTKMYTCHSYVGIALNAALRMGLHRSMNLNLNPIEREVRKRIFWVIRKMDIYVAALLGLPKGIADEDIDQEMPLEVDDEYITENELRVQPEGTVPVMALVNAHTRLLNIMAKVVKAIYPLKQGCASGNSGYAVSFGTIREIEIDLRRWNDALPGGTVLENQSSPKHDKSRYLLEMAYYHVQMMMYRPFIHYICSSTSHGNNAIMAARNCIRVAIRIVYLTDTMKERGVLNGAYWFTMYTTFFATISLVFFVLEKPNGNNACWKAANTGKAALDSLEAKSHAALKCSIALKRIFDSIPTHIIELLEKEVENPPELNHGPSQNSLDSRNIPVWLQSLPASRRFNSVPAEPQADRKVEIPDPKRSRKGSQETGSPSTFSSIPTPDQQLQFPTATATPCSGVDTVMMYTAPVFYTAGVSPDHPNQGEQIETDTQGSFTPSSREMVYNLEAQVRSSWAYNLSGQPPVSTGGDVASVQFGNPDINSANSSLMLLQGQTYGSMPGGGSAMALEDIFGDDGWAEHVLQHQMFRP